MAQTLKRYEIGERPPADALRLHLNEYQFDHHPEVLAVVQAQAADPRLLTTYVDEPLALRSAIATYLSVQDENVVVGAGSDEILRAIIDACALRGMREVIGFDPTYTHFTHFARLRGLRWISLNMGLDPTSRQKSAQLQLYDAELSAGALVYLCSPNNPTGEWWNEHDIRSLARKYRRSVFLVDEAYGEFEGAALSSDNMADAATALNTASAVSLTVSHDDVHAHDNVVVSRTFSKAFGLAGLRVGYCAAGIQLAGEIRVAVSPKSVTGIAAAAALACSPTRTITWRTPAKSLNSAGFSRTSCAV